MTGSLSGTVQILPPTAGTGQFPPNTLPSCDPGWEAVRCSIVPTSGLASTFFREVATPKPQTVEGGSSWGSWKDVATVLQPSPMNQCRLPLGSIHTAGYWSWHVPTPSTRSMGGGQLPERVLEESVTPQRRLGSAAHVWFIKP